MAPASIASSLYTAQSFAGVDRRARALAASIYRLSSGNRYGVGEDNASLTVATLLQANAAAYRQGFKNSVTASSLVSVAAGGLDRIRELLVSARATAVTAQSDVLTDAERASLQTSLESDLAAIDGIASTTTFNDIQLLDGTLAEDDGGEALAYAIGSGDDSIITIEIRDASTDRLFSGGTPSLLSSSDADDAVDDIDAALDLIDTAIFTLGGDASRVDFATENLKTQIAGQEAAASDISDTDITEESTRYTAQYIKQQAAYALLAQARNLSSGLLSLLNFGNPTTGTPTSNATTAAARNQQALFFTSNE